MTDFEKQVVLNRLHSRITQIYRSHHRSSPKGRLVSHELNDLWARVDVLCGVNSVL